MNSVAALVDMISYARQYETQVRMMDTAKQDDEATTQQYLPEHLLATVMQTLFDPTEARLETGIPSELARMINGNAAISELF